MKEEELQMRKMMSLLFALCAVGVLSGCAQQQCEHVLAADVTRQATCQSTGILTYTCEKCGVQFTAEVPVTGHDYVEMVTKEATCQEKGELTRTCRVCGATETEQTAEMDHVYDMYSLEPSRCTVCGQLVEGGGVDTANPWYGKNWVALGTALTSEEQGTYVQPLAERSGLEVSNCGVPGAEAGNQVLKNAQSSEILSGADLVTVEFGINDWFANVPLGSVGDVVPYRSPEADWDNGGNEEGSFAGACYQVFCSIQENAPNAVVVFLTQPTGQDSSITGDNCQRGQTNALDLRQEDYTEMAVAVARYCGIRVIDAGRTSMIGQEHPAYLEDHIRQTELGGKQYALTVWMELKDAAPLLREDS